MNVSFVNAEAIIKYNGVFNDNNTNNADTNNNTNNNINLGTGDTDNNINSNNTSTTNPNTNTNNPNSSTSPNNLNTTDTGELAIVDDLVKCIIRDIEDVGFDATVKRIDRGTTTDSGTYIGINTDTVVDTWTDTETVVSSSATSTSTSTSTSAPTTTKSIIPNPNPNYPIPSYFVLEIVITNCTSALGTYIEQTVVPQLIQIGDNSNLVRSGSGAGTGVGARNRPVKAILSVSIE